MSRGDMRGAYAVLFCGIVVLVLSFGIRTSFGIFLNPVTESLAVGRESFALAMAVQNLLWGLAQPFAGAVADRYGPGRVVAACGGLYALGLYLMSQATTSGDLMLGAGVLIGLALSGTGFPVILAVIGRSVSEEKRSLFLGIGSAGGSSGQLLMVPAAHLLLDGFGWVTALLILAVLTTITVPLAKAFAGRTGTSGPGLIRDQSMPDAIREASRHSGFWLLTAGFFVCGFHVAFIATHLPAFIVDHGRSAAIGAAALAVIGLGNIIGSLTCGYLGGRFSKKYVLSGLYLGRSIVFVVFLLVPLSDVSIIVFSAVIGMLWLGTVPLTSGLVAQIFGVRYMAMLFGFVFFSHQLGSFMGAWVGGYVFDRTGSYDPVWWMSVALGLLAAALHWPIKDQPVSDLEPQRA
ncbi:MAG: MFS transporter [Gammaproteobacteria bacterium]|nr:MFS transporter [Gammaproteobacteria bacterium]